jgi:serine/threonine protein kinase
VAPEQISGRPVDERCDVYSLACVVQETLTGRPPFQRDDDMALLWAHQYDQPPRLTDARPDIAAPVDGVLAKALAKSPDDRYDSCLAFVAALRTAATRAAEAGGHAPTQVDLRVAGTPGSPGPPPAPPRWALPVFPRPPG